MTTPTKEEVLEETAWLIEHGGHPSPLYWTGRSWGEWSDDHMKACRFARRHDAQKVALALGDPTSRPNNHKVVEHMWTSPRAQEPEPEPVDPLLIEAREIAAKYWEGQGDHIGADNHRSGDKDDWASAQIALAALRRGMELRPQITREMVGNAFAEAASLPFKRSEAYYGITIDRLHAALTAQVQHD